MASVTIPQCVHRLFESQAIRVPDKTAIIAGDQILTYSELNRRADQLANQLASVAVKPGCRVAILAARSVDAVIGILAVLKSGGAYVPMDASYPVDRLAYMLRDSEASVVLAPPADIADWIPRDVTIIRSGRAEEFRYPDWKDPVQPKDVAFVVYTSGSTGDPKGVTTTHASMCAYLASLRHALQVSEGDVFLHTASLAFSSSNRQLFLPLCEGSTVVMAAREDIADPIRLFGLMKTQHITVIDVVPSFWRGCISALADLDELERRCLLENDLRLVLSASEALPGEVVGRWRSLNHPARLVNMYGMTETTGIVTTYAIPDAIGDTESYSGVVPIGRPIDGVEYRILDSVSASDDIAGCFSRRVALDSNGAATSLNADSVLEACSSTTPVPHELFGPTPTQSPNLLATAEPRASEPRASARLIKTASRTHTLRPLVSRRSATSHVAAQVSNVRPNLTARNTQRYPESTGCCYWRKR